MCVLRGVDTGSCACLCSVLLPLLRSDMNHLQQQQGQDADDPVDWQQHPEHAGAIVVHHETILKLKRILLTYM